MKMRRAMNLTATALLAPGTIAGLTACSESASPRDVIEYVVTGVNESTITLGGCVIKYTGLAGPYPFEVTTGTVPEGWADKQPHAVAMYADEGGEFNGISIITPAVTRDRLRSALGGSSFSPNGGVYEGILPQARGDIACGEEVSADSEILVYSKDENGGGHLDEWGGAKLLGEIVTVQSLGNGDQRLLVMRD